MEQEQWQLGTAEAVVQRVTGAAITVRVRGVVTAAVIEALHLRLGREPAGLLRTLLLGDDALLVVTNISAAEAAVRGTPATTAGLCPIALGVTPARMTWALDHCMITAQFGLQRTAFPLAAAELNRLVAPSQSASPAS